MIPPDCPRCGTKPEGLVFYGPVDAAPRWCPICGSLWSGKNWTHPVTRFEEVASPTNLHMERDDGT